MGRQTKRTLPMGAFETMVYDAAGNLLRRIDFNGATIVYAYDEFNDRLLRRSYPDGSSVGFTYTPTGQRKTVVDSRGTTTYNYDNRDRMLSLTYPDVHKLEYVYDKNGDRTGLTAIIGTTVLTTVYTYDDASRLDTVTDPQDRFYDYGYDANGNRTSLAFPNGTSTAYDYNALNRLINLTTAGPSGTIQSYQFTLGPAGNRTRIDELGGTSRAYTYDELYRLTRETITGSSAYTNTFTYDPVGNRQTQIKTIPTGTNLLGYNYDARDRLLTENAANYIWDSNGNLITKSGADGATYTWDFENRLIRVDKTDGTVITHTYDADGNRVQTRTTPSGGATTTTNYLVDPSGSLSQVVAETNGSGSLTAYYVRGDDLLAVIRGTQTRFYHADGLGSIRLLTDESGNTTDTYTYSAFGELLGRTGNDPNAYLFAGEPLDFNSGFYYNRARWMDPRVGRFVGIDPWDPDIYDPPTLHRYSYVRNDPSNRADPTGLYEGGLATTMTVVAINYSGLLTVVKAMAIACASMTILSAATGVGSGGPCDFSKENFFFPGMETPETTAHIRDAIAMGHPADLVYTKRSESFRNWYRNMLPCNTNKASESKKWCDEYPFASTLQGGPGASLRLVPAWEQILQGIELYAFYVACNILLGNEINRAFRVQPTVGITHWLCK